MTIGLGAAGSCAQLHQRWERIEGAGLCPVGSLHFGLKEVQNSQGHAVNWSWTQVSKQAGNREKRPTECRLGGSLQGGSSGLVCWGSWDGTPWSNDSQANAWFLEMTVSLGDFPTQG